MRSTGLLKRRDWLEKLWKSCGLKSCGKVVGSKEPCQIVKREAKHQVYLVRAEEEKKRFANVLQCECQRLEAFRVATQS